MLIDQIKKIERKIYTFFFSDHSSYIFSSKKLDILLRIFYCVSLALIIHEFSYRVSYPSWLENNFIDWSWPVMWLLNYFESKFIILFTVFCLSVFFCALSVFFIRSIWLKLACALSFFILSAFDFSTGRPGHYYHCWLFVFIVFAFIGHDKKKDQFFFHLAQFWLLMTYSLSGFHKLTALIDYIRQFGLKGLKPIEKSIAVRIYDFPNYDTGKAILMEISSWPSSLLLFLWALLIWFQISCIFVLFRPPLYRLWGLLIIFFHLVTVFFLNVMFFYNMILTSFLFVETPYNIDFSIKKSILNIPGVQSLLSLIKRCHLLLKKIPASLKDTCKKK